MKPPQRSFVPCGGLVLCASAGLFGCPQLLDDSFQTTPDAGSPDGGAGKMAKAPDKGPGPAPAPAPGPGPLGGATARLALADASEPDAPTPDASTPDAELRAALRSALLHRYRFDDTDSVVADSVGTLDATAVGVSETGGAAILAGTEPGSPGYIDLPNGEISSLRGASFEAWVFWDVDAAASSSTWQRIFDFGSSQSAEGQQGGSANYLYLSPKGGTGRLRLEYRLGGDAAITVEAPGALPARVLAQVVAVVDEAADRLSLYLDGRLQGSAAFPGQLSGLPDSNNWLGRSQYSADPDFKGRILDFRIYGTPLDASAIELSERLGPDATL
jgi:hypothetical protein